MTADEVEAVGFVRTTRETLATGDAMGRTQFGWLALVRPQMRPSIQRLIDATVALGVLVNKPYAKEAAEQIRNYSESR